MTDRKKRRAAFLIVLLLILTSMRNSMSGLIEVMMETTRYPFPAF